jgi:hypothetical protein
MPSLRVSCRLPPSKYDGDQRLLLLVSVGLLSMKEQADFRMTCLERKDFESRHFSMKHAMASMQWICCIGQAHDKE